MFWLWLFGPTKRQRRVLAQAVARDEIEQRAARLRVLQQAARFGR